MSGVPRKLEAVEIAAVVGLVVPLRLATIDELGFPHVTPLWFEWDAGAFWMTSLPHRPHVRRLLANPRASACVDVEEDEQFDGERPNRQVRAVGKAEVLDGVGGERTRRITQRYLSGPGLEPMLRKRTGARRVAIRLEPTELVAIASV